jgi:ethanolamine ammonia-lyase small subunit
MSERDTADRFQQPEDVKDKSCHPERSGTKWSEVEGPAVSPGLNNSFDLSSRPERSGVEGPAVSAISATELPETKNQHPLTQLRQFTPARIALGRTGSSLPTKELLDFNAAHAMARDAVHAPFDISSITQQLTATHLESVTVHSAATDRTTYLRRPDLGRKLDEPSRTLLAKLNHPTKPEVVFIIADGLSAIAPQRYAVRVIRATYDLLPNWQIAPIIIAEQARVALGDEIGELLGAEIAVMLIGERPGLSSADSLGIYLTYAPKPGRTDAERNCISNIREEGTSPEQAAQTLHHLLTRSRRLKLSGVELKDEELRNHKDFPLIDLSS